jgi:hypothetical protein
VIRIPDEGAARGEIRAVDPRRVTMAIFSVTNWSVESFDADRGASIDEVAEFFANLLIDGLHAPGQADRDPRPRR